MSRNLAAQACSRDPVELLLRRILERGVLLGSAATFAVACSGVETQGTEVQCLPSGGALIAASGLKTNEAFDYLAVRDIVGSTTGPGSVPSTETWTRTSFTTISERGTACAAVSSPTCAAKLSTHPKELVAGYCVEACTEVSVVTTRGEIVERWAGTEELVSLLAPIDSGDEANLLVAAAGYDVPCGKYSGVQEVSDGFETYGQKITSFCDPIKTTLYHLHVASTGEVSVLEHDVIKTEKGTCIGRIPAGLRSVDRPAADGALGAHLAHCAHLEAASVIAFERLARELATHRAPAELIQAALRAAGDEVRHAQVMTSLARAHGSEPSEVEVDELPRRSLEEIALENATEGCVRETYGALIGGYQAEHAHDRTLAEAMSVIAEDEARHASLSHRVHAWAISQLDAAARARIAQGQQRAILLLLQECAAQPDPELRKLAGLPSATLATAFAGELARELWNASGRA